MDAALWSALQTSPAAMQRLQGLAGLVGKWNPAINLVARSTLSDLWSRHIEDSARLLLFSPALVRHWADFGSGGGFPGLVIAVLLQDRGADTQVTLVESDQRKATFLREAVRTLGQTAEVRTERAEVLAPLAADVISARALSPLSGLCAIVERHLASDGLALFPKGETWQSEVAEARKTWRFDLEAAVDPGHKGAILKLRSIARA